MRQSRIPAALAATLLIWIALAASACTTAPPADKPGVDTSGMTKAASPEGIVMVSDVAKVTGATDLEAVELTTNPDAIYQVAFDSDESGRLVIVSIDDATVYDQLVGEASAGLELEGVGDAAVSTEGAVLFKKGDRSAIIATVQTQTGANAIAQPKLEDIARIASARM